MLLPSADKKIFLVLFFSFENITFGRIFIHKVKDKDTETFIFWFRSNRTSEQASFSLQLENWFDAFSKKKVVLKMFKAAKKIVNIV